MGATKKIRENGKVYLGAIGLIWKANKGEAETIKRGGCIFKDKGNSWCLDSRNQTHTTSYISIYMFIHKVTI